MKIKIAIISSVLASNLYAGILLELTSEIISIPFLPFTTTLEVIANDAEGEEIQNIEQLDNLIKESYRKQIEEEKTAVEG